VCGIVATMPADEAFVRRAQRHQARRGPDSEVVTSCTGALLGVTRLAITDIANGAQPLTDASGQLTVAFNGAIYNWRDVIERCSFAPITNNDGEAIIAAYLACGSGFADLLEGMFAIVIWDADDGSLTIAVDPVGVKPLYWYRKGEQLRVASTATAFPPDQRAGMERFPNGMVWNSKTGFRAISREPHTKEPDLLAAITNSVLQQIPDEVPWGSLLSGGVDSTLIAAIAQRSTGSLRTFVCGMKDGGSDLAWAQRAAKAIGATHTVCVISEEEITGLVREVVACTGSYELHTVRGGVPTYAVARQAHNVGIKVLLSGEGADELFGGYDEFQELPSAQLASALVQSQEDLGATECLRLDRCTMAHSIEARVPFLSRSVIAQARALPVNAKIARTSMGTVCKLALREAASQVIPRDIAFRPKTEFTHGSGVSATIDAIARDMFTDGDVVALARDLPGLPITTPTTAWFASEWVNQFGTTFGLSAESHRARGLARQPFSIYQPSYS
jgi:asparagine synthase (glutamine-hydrolysing)